MTLYFTSDEETQFLREKNETHFKSQFGFLNSHNGLRRGSIHLVIGETSGGKSTLMRSLVRDIVGNNNATLGLWLSEESVKDYKTMVSIGLPSSDKLLNTQVFSEIDNMWAPEQELWKWLEMHKPDVLIYDNVTTSKFYMDRKPDAQAAFIVRLKEAAKRLNMATIAVAHTDSQTRPGLIEINHIRGSRQLPNMAEFAYILQRFKLKNEWFSTIRIVKHRSQDLIHDLYLLRFDKRFSSYLSDSDLEFEKFKEAYALRNRL